MKEKTEGFSVEWRFPNICTKEQRKWYVEESVTHPAKMNVLLARKLIKEFTKPAETVLDLMAGCGTTNVEAMLLGRNTIAVDLEKKFTELVEANIRKVKETNAKMRFPLRLGEAKVICGDSRKLSELLNEVVDSIVTSPPYGQAKIDISPQLLYKFAGRKLFEKGRDPQPHAEGQIGDLEYGIIDEVIKTPQNIGNVKRETYLQSMFSMYRECFKLLKPSGVMVLVLKNFVRNYQVVDLVSNTIQLCEVAGFRLVKLIKHKVNGQSFWRINHNRQWKKKFGNPFPREEFASVCDFETILVFTRPKSLTRNWGSGSSKKPNFVETCNSKAILDLKARARAHNKYYGICPKCGTQFNYEQDVGRLVRCRYCFLPMRLKGVGGIKGPEREVNK